MNNLATNAPLKLQPVVATALKPPPPQDLSTTTMVKEEAGVEPSTAKGKKVKKKRKLDRKRMKKAPGAPRRFKTAFIFFSTAKHKELRQAMGDKRASKEKTTSVAKKVSQAWKDLSKEERAVWDSIAAKDKARYELEKSMYKGPWHVPDTGRDPTAPKRPCSAFITFLNHKREDVKQMHPEASSVEIVRIISKLWRESPEREVFLAQETEERQKYKRDLEEWNEMQKRTPEAVMASQREEMAWTALEAEEQGQPKMKRLRASAKIREAVLATQHDDAISLTAPDSRPLATAAAARPPSEASYLASAASTSREPLVPDMTVSHHRQTVGHREKEVTSPVVPQHAVAASTAHAFRIGLQAAERLRYSGALQRQALIQQLAGPLRLSRSPGLVSDPVSLELRLRLQRERDLSRDLLVLDLLRRGDSPLI